MKLYGYNNLIMESTNKKESILFFFSQGMRKMLENIMSKYSDEIAHFLLNNVDRRTYASISYVDLTSDLDLISYSPGDRVLGEIREKGLDPRSKDIVNVRKGWTENRQQMKIGRLLGRIAESKFTQKQIEEFINRFKAESKKNIEGLDWRRVYGRDINNWYMGNMYVKGGGTLNRSCLRRKEKNQFLNFLAGNPNKVRLQLLVNDQGLLLGRSLIWKLDEPEGRIYMDRIYTRFDEDVNMFIESAKKHGYLYKSKQTYGGEVPLIDGRDGEQKWIKLVCNDFRKRNFSGYPYIDTLQYYDMKNNILTNDVGIFTNNTIAKLNKTDGGYTTFEEGDVDIGDMLDD